MNCPDCAKPNPKRHCRVCSWRVCSCGTVFEPTDPYRRKWSKPKAAA